MNMRDVQVIPKPNPDRASLEGFTAVSADGVSLPRIDLGKADDARTIDECPARHEVWKPH
jgi:hypothetical protein